MTQKRPPTLTDAKGMGGIHAQGGFDYQVWDALVRVPAWIKDPGFEGLGNEVLEDIEARFFSPYAPAGQLLDRFQAKSSQLTKGELQKVFETFRDFDANFPETARVHTLVTPSLPKALVWLNRDAVRVRRARPFYAPFADIQAASDAKLRSDLVDEFGDDLGVFVSECVEISIRQLPDQMAAIVTFAAAFHDAFPNERPSHDALEAAHKALFELCRKNRGALTARADILAVLRQALQAELYSDQVLPLHMLSDKNATRNDAIQIDARLFAGGDQGFPQPKDWRMGLQEPLMRTAAWAGKQGVSRISLSGMFRLTTGFLIGWAFRSATGFEIDVPTKIDVWPTDSHPPDTEPALPWTVIQPQQLLDDRLLVCIGILRDPLLGILKAFAEVSESHLLRANLPEALRSTVDVQSSVRIVKRAVDEACASLKPSGIDVYFAGPAAFAVALGHRWNALPPTQLHEFLPEQGGYSPTAIISS